MKKKYSLWTSADYLKFSLLIILCLNCSSNEISESNNIFEYYSTQSKYTDPGKYVHLYDGIPAKIDDIVSIVQGVLVHLAQVEEQHLPFPKNQIDRGLGCSSVKKMLRNISKLDNRNLVFKRPIKKRSVGICTHFAMLTCSLLRHNNIPARCRGGFETYFSSNKHHDHWICEYWNSEENRWVRIDPEVNDFFNNKFSVPASNLDLPDSVFKSGAQVWKECRNGEADPTHFGISGDHWYGGWDFVVNEIVLDFLALNKIELLPWDGNKLSEKGYDKLNRNDFILLDKAAKFSKADNENFKKMRSFYKTNKKFHK